MADMFSNKFNTSIKVFVVMIVVVVVLWAINWIAVGNGFNGCQEGWQTRGQFGDMFGAVNALFSGLAFAGLVYTIILQRDQITLQQREIDNANKEGREQRRLMNTQTFETTFFSLLQRYRDTVQYVNYRFIDYSTNGVTAFNAITSNLRSRLGEIITHSGESELSDDERRQLAYNDLVSRTADPLKHYVLALTVVLNYIERHFGSDVATKTFYHQVTEAASTPGEIEFLRYYTTFGRGTPVRLAIANYIENLDTNTPLTT